MELIILLFVVIPFAVGFTINHFVNKQITAKKRVIFILIICLLHLFMIILGSVYTHHATLRYHEENGSFSYIALGGIMFLGSIISAFATAIIFVVNVIRKKK